MRVRRNARAWGFQSLSPGCFEPRVFGRVVLVALCIAALALVAGLLFVAPAATVAQEPLGIDRAARALAAASVFARDRVSGHRVASALAALQKTLVLESTRSARDVAVYQRAAPAVVLVVTKTGRGSGAIIDNTGHIITNWHVVKEDPDAVVILKPNDSTQLRDELAFSVTVEKTDSVVDLALLKIDVPPGILRPLPLGDMSIVAVGQDAHAVGHPDGEVWTYTKGVVSQIRRKYQWSDGSVAHEADVIQTQTPLGPGSSGGPLVDDAGRLIGLNFGASSESRNYAIAVDEIRAFLQPESRKSVQLPSQTQPGQPRCLEAYDTTGRGWKNIVGCYLSGSSPPPDFWLVSRVAGQNATYGAKGSPTGTIDTIVIPKDTEWRQLDFYIDLDCDGRVDLIRRSIGDRMLTYRVPFPVPTLASLAPELAAALQAGRLPHRALKLCS